LTDRYFTHLVQSTNYPKVSDIMIIELLKTKPLFGRGFHFKQHFVLFDKLWVLHLLRPTWNCFLFKRILLVFFQCWTTKIISTVFLQCDKWKYWFYFRILQCMFHVFSDKKSLINNEQTWRFCLKLKSETEIHSTIFLLKNISYNLSMLVLNICHFENN
jgi:hypothetical protein